MSSNEPTLEALALLLRELPPAPAGWVVAAQELPLARAGLDAIVARAEQDRTYRQVLVADLEAALRETGIEPRPHLMRELRQRLES